MRKLFLVLIFLLPNICLGGNMKITINNKIYDIKLDNNIVVDEIVSKVPFELEMINYAGHEFYDELPFTPSSKGVGQTSDLKAGHIYYWAGGNSFVLNYRDFDISPYKSVHIGEFTDMSVIDVLKKGSSKIDIKIDK